MRTIALDQIIIPQNRIRKEFDAASITELATSISAVGLLQPIVLRNDGRTLVVGERRTRAIRELNKVFSHDGAEIPVGSIPFVLISDLSSDALYQAELEENVVRRDFTWQERARALKAFHALRTRQAAANGTVQPVSATASEVVGRKAKGSQITEVNNAVLVAEFLEDPEVAAQPDMASAIKVIRENHKQQQRKQLAASVDFSKSSHQLHMADSITDAPERYRDYFDVIVTDPPYGIDAHKKDTFDTTRHEYDDSSDVWARILTELPGCLHTITKPAAHVYVFCDIRRFEELFVAFELGGFTVWPRPLIWDKGNTGSYGNIEYGFRACYDAILFARKGDRKMATIGRDIFAVPQQTDHSHPAGKPVALYEEILRRSALPGDRVADLFAGSAPLFPAAQKLKLYATCWENHPKYIPMSQASLAKTIGA
jgi:site-specific DNA-methyltransferase (adenine-specific)